MKSSAMELPAINSPAELSVEEIDDSDISLDVAINTLATKNKAYDVVTV